MLRNIRGRDEHLGQRNGVVRQEVELEVVLGVWVGVDNASDIDDEADSLQKCVNIISTRKRRFTYQLSDVVWRSWDSG